MDGPWIIGTPSLSSRIDEVASSIWNWHTATVTALPRGSWSALNPTLPHSRFSFDQRQQVLESRDLLTNDLQWTYQPIPETSVITRDAQAILLCHEAGCTLLDSRTGTRLHEFAPYPQLVAAFLLPEQVVFVSHQGYNTTLVVDSFNRTSGAQESHVTIQPAPDLFTRDMHAAVSAEGYLAVAFGVGTDAYDYAPAPRDFSPAYLYNLHTGEQVAVLDVHTDAINTLLFNPSGTLLVLASSDRSFSIWDMRKF